jgi:hypothetical protein
VCTQNWVSWHVELISKESRPGTGMVKMWFKKKSEARRTECEYDCIKVKYSQF